MNWMSRQETTPSTAASAGTPKPSSAGIKTPSTSDRGRVLGAVDADLGFDGRFGVPPGRYDDHRARRVCRQVRHHRAGRQVAEFAEAARTEHEYGGIG